MSTPQLHYLVRKANREGTTSKIRRIEYLDDVLDAYRELLSLLHKSKKSQTKKDHIFLGDLVVDCANGVGGLSLQHVAKELSKEISINLIHLPGEKVKVNDNCGAEHIHVSLSYISLSLSLSLSLSFSLFALHFRSDSAQ